MTFWLGVFCGIVAAFAVSFIFSLLVLGAARREAWDQGEAKLDELLRWVSSACAHQSKLKQRGIEIEIHRPRGFLKPTGVN